MDDFRLDPIGAADSYRDRQTPNGPARRKPRPPKPEEQDPDEFVLAGAGDAEDAGGVTDYYSPSDNGVEPE
ncbi:MAG TPA: hypothetical protein VMU19_10250 [Bryobacteraceae bacterium]|nr:hypothetical protein [Bryobacteraceae bacterium]